MGNTRNRRAAVTGDNGDGGNSSGIEGNSGTPGNDAGAADAGAADAGAGAGAGGTADAGAGAGTDAGAASEAGSRNDAAVNPADLVDDFERDATGAIVYKADGVTPRRKRGRRPGSASPAAPAPSPASAPKAAKAKAGDRSAMAVEMLAAQFQILNMGIAFVTKFPDWNLTDSEAKQMASATEKVMEQFDYVPDPKVAAVLGLVTTTGMIYGPRVYLYRKHIATKQTERRQMREAAADQKVATPGYDGPMNLGQFSG